MTIPTELPEFKISLKTKTKAAELFQIHSPGDIAEVARKCFDADSIEWVESMVVIALNQAHKVIGFYKVAQGGVSMTVCDPKVVMQFALLSNASAIVLAHNHPSGNLRPSNADIEITKKIEGAAKLLDMRLLDHIIVTADGYFSFAEDGLL